ncbi:unnamed protein product [Anisakis simplex]|uniref:COesterase domain-containing protein n=1 Tax=Anisakis simplex TaxID=6269 RepID=A0A0M3JHB0_ANISI|nr:unnamed protein product [Anisakis simplex]
MIKQYFLAVPHTAELPFIWMQEPIWRKAIDSLEVVPGDYEMADFFGKMWTLFAKTGFKWYRCLSIFFKSFLLSY